MIAKGFILFFFDVSQKQKVNNNQKDCAVNSGEIESIFYCPLYHDSILLAKNNEEVKKTKAKKRPTEDKVIFSNKEAGFKKKGVIIPPVNQAAAIVLKKLDKTRNWPILNLRIGFTILIVLSL